MDFFPTYMRITSKKVELPDGKIDYSSTWKTLKQLKFPADFIEASNRVKKYNRA